MMNQFPLSSEILFLTGYIIFSSLLNLIALLISSFYQKKFSQESPKAGFIIAIALAMLFVGVIIFGKKGEMIAQIAIVFTLIGSSIASSLSILNLYLTMRKIRK